MKIRFCEHNKGSEQFMRQLAGRYSDLDIKLKKCAKQCKTCKQQPFAVIDKQLVLFASVDELDACIGERRKKNL